MSTILFVDDSRRIRQFWQRELEQCGYTVWLAANGEEAVDVTREMVPDLVVLDIRMPGSDGVGTISRLLELDPDLPVIFYSAHLDDLEQDFRGWLASAWVDKRGEVDDLKHAITRVIREGKVRRTQPTPVGYGSAESSVGGGSDHERTDG